MGRKLFKAFVDELQGIYKDLDIKGNSSNIKSVC